MNKYNRRLNIPGSTSRLTGKAGVAQRKRIRERDNYHCRKCSRPVLRGEVDHVVSLDNGGSNDDDNLWLLCVDCHRDKTTVDMGYKVKTEVDSSGLPINKNHHWNI